jgi:hypothetical protein
VDEKLTLLTDVQLTGVESERSCSTSLSVTLQTLNLPVEVLGWSVGVSCPLGDTEVTLNLPVDVETTGEGLGGACDESSDLNLETVNPPTEVLGCSSSGIGVSVSAAFVSCTVSRMSDVGSCGGVFDS